jgi:nucleoside phosphorylase
MPNVLLVAATELELCGRDGLVCGVGPVEAAAATARALAAAEPGTAVLHVGLAGSDELAPGSLVVGSQAVYDDLVARWPIVARVPPDPDLVESALRALPGAELLPVRTSARVDAPRQTTPGTPLVEAMEGFGVLRAAQLAGVPAVEVRVVSNEVGEEDRERWSVDAALETLGRVLPQLVESIGTTTVRATSRFR